MEGYIEIADGRRSMKRTPVTVHCFLIVVALLMYNVIISRLSCSLRGWFCAPACSQIRRRSSDRTNIWKKNSAEENNTAAWWKPCRKKESIWLFECWLSWQLRFLGHVRNCLTRVLLNKRRSIRAPLAGAIAPPSNRTWLLTASCHVLLLLYSFPWPIPFGKTATLYYRNIIL